MIADAIVYVRLSSSWYNGWLRSLNTQFWFLSSWYDVYLCLGNSEKQSIYDYKQKKKNQINDR